MRVAAILIVLGLIFMGMMSQNIVVSEAYGASSGSSSTNTTNGSVYLQQVVNRMMLLLRIIAYGALAALWVWKVILPLASTSRERKEEGKENIKDLAIATIIVIMAVEGMIWMIFHWIAMGT